MNIQKSFNQSSPALSIVATPIGNLGEMTSRAVATLQKADVILCEDTRESQKLLNHFDIKSRLISCHKFNEKEMQQTIIDFLTQGKNVALISDAGYPLLSDPGNLTVRNVIACGFNVIVNNGANAALHALVASGFETAHYTFYGFLDNKKAEREEELKRMAGMA